MLNTDVEKLTNSAMAGIIGAGVAFGLSAVVFVMWFFHYV